MRFSNCTKHAYGATNQINDIIDNGPNINNVVGLAG